MYCKICGKNISGNDYKKVAEWTFCLDCFDDLLKPSEQKKVIVEDNLINPPLKNSLEIEKKANSCMVCNSDMKKGSEKKLGIWNLCESCYKDLTSRPKETTSFPTEEDSQENKTDRDPEFIDNDHTNNQTNTNKIIICSKCKRDILAKAAKENGDKFFCPDCFYKNN